MAIRIDKTTQMLNSDELKKFTKSLKQLKVKYPNHIAICRLDNYLHIIGGDIELTIAHLLSVTNVSKVLECNGIEYISFNIDDLDAVLYKLVRNGLPVLLLEELEHPKLTRQTH